MIAHAGGWYCNNASQSGYRAELAEDFDDTLIFHKMFEYKSARAYFRSEKSGRFYCMFLDDFDALLRLGLFQNNKITARFRFTKRGQGQGIKVVLHSSDEARLKDMIEAQHNDNRTKWF